METPESHPISERCFVWLEKTLQDRKNPEGTIAKFSRRCRKSLTIFTVAYFLFLTVLVVALGWWGERHWLLSVLLFVPAALWLVPLILLTPLHLVFRPKLCGFTLASVLIIVFVYLDFNWSFDTKKSETGLVVVTSNIGQREARPLIAFLKTENPDIIALQDAWYVGRMLKAQYPDRFVAMMDEYVLVSRFPIRKSGLLSQFQSRGHPIGAWHEIDYNGRTIVVYNIHMPTPRPEFRKLWGHGFLADAFGGKGVFSAEVRKGYAEFVQTRIQFARGLIEVLEKEQRPFLVVGDFNMTANGYIWDLFRTRFTDAFGAKGRGFGFTFPSTSANPLSLFGPWLGLDYLFAGKDWQPTFCRVEPRQPGQHRAVVAQFELENPDNARANSRQ